MAVLLREHRFLMSGIWGVLLKGVYGVRLGKSLHLPGPLHSHHLSNEEVAAAYQTEVPSRSHSHLGHQPKPLSSELLPFAIILRRRIQLTREKRTF